MSTVTERFYARSGNVNNYDLIESKGVRIYIEPTATMFLIGSLMDYSSDKIASRFVFKNCVP